MNHAMNQTCAPATGWSSTNPADLQAYEARQADREAAASALKSHPLTDAELEAANAVTAAKAKLQRLEWVVRAIGDAVRNGDVGPKAAEPWEVLVEAAIDAVKAAWSRLFKIQNGEAV